jgi:hypothetical protein
MQEREELRALKRCQERENKEKSMSMEKKEKNRKVKKEKNMCMRERKRREREKRSGEKDMRGMNQVKERKNKSARKDVTLLRDETFTLFPTMCNPTTRTSSVPRSHIFCCPCTCPPF